MRKHTINLAKNLIQGILRVNPGYKGSTDPSYVANQVQRFLESAHKDPAYGVDDGLVDVYYSVVHKKQWCRTAPSALAKILKDRGEIKKNPKTGHWEPTRPTFEQLSAVSNDDDQQGAESIAHSMDNMVSTDMGPGSDLHIAAIDIGEAISPFARHLFEVMQGGGNASEAARTWDAEVISQQRASYTLKRIKKFIRDGGYSLYHTNVRLGDPKGKTGNMSFLESERQRREPFPPPKTTNINHRGIVYTEEEKPDYYTPIPPQGDEARPVPSHLCHYQTCKGIEDLTDEPI